MADWKCTACGGTSVTPSLDGALIKCDFCQTVQNAVPAQPALPDANPKTVFGMQKRSYANVPKSAQDALADAMSSGAKKYGRYNWRKAGVTSSIYYDAIRRHLEDWFDGTQAPDKDSGLSHLAHVMACCAILIDAQETGNLNDDRHGQGGGNG